MENMYKKSFYACGVAVVTIILETLGTFQFLFHLDKPMSIAAAILIIAAFCWITEWIPLYITAFVILFLQLVWLLPVLHPVATASITSTSVLSPFFSNIILLFLGGFVLAALLNEYGIDKIIAYWLLKRTGTNPARILIGFMLITAFLSMWMSNTATTAMMFSILLPILKAIPADNKFIKALPLGIPFAANIGGLATPVGTPPNAIALGYLQQAGIHISFLQWMIYALPSTILFLVIAIVIILLYCRDTKVDIVLPPLEKKSLTTAQISSIGIALFTVILWMTKDFHGMSMGEVSLIPVILAFSSGLLTKNHFLQLPWNILFMVGGGLSLAVGLKASGFSAHVVNSIPEHVSAAILVTSFIVITVIAASFMSRSVAANLILPLAVAFSSIQPVLAILIAFACSVSMPLPVSTPPNAIAFSSGFLESKDMCITGTAITVICFSLLLLFVFFQL